MTRFLTVVAAVCAPICLTACAGGPERSASPAAATGVSPLAFTSESAIDADYRIGAGDLLSISVFQIPELSNTSARVDAAGNIQMPLVGAVRASGQTPQELGDHIRTRLAARYLQNPQLSVIVSEAASQKVTVDGAVKKPGVYTMRGRTSLLQAVAMAEGAQRAADLSSVAVFRHGAEGRMVAVFDLAAIRNGDAADPVLQGDDVVVVDTSRLSAALQDALQAVPALAVFRYF